MNPRFLTLLLLAVTPLFAMAQSQTTEALNKSNEEAFKLFFYNNTLRMLNQSEDPAFDALIKDIERMKFLMIKKEGSKFDYKKLVGDYKSENFEMAMTSRHEGKSFDVLLKGDKKTEGMIVLVNDAENLMVLDIVGSIALDQVQNLYKTLDQSSDIGKRIKSFTGDGDEDEDDKHEDKN